MRLRAVNTRSDLGQSRTPHRVGDMPPSDGEPVVLAGALALFLFGGVLVERGV